MKLKISDMKSPPHNVKDIWLLMDGRLWEVIAHSNKRLNELPIIGYSIDTICQRMSDVEKRRRLRG